MKGQAKTIISTAIGIIVVIFIIWLILVNLSAYDDYCKEHPYSEACASPIELCSRDCQNLNMELFEYEEIYHNCWCKVGNETKQIW